MAITTDFTIIANTTFASVYEKISYTVTPSVVGTGGTISPSGIQNVNSGGSCTFTFSPNSGYAINSVKVNQATVSVSNNTYTISNITKDTTIEVSYAPLELKLLQDGYVRDPHQSNLTAFIRPRPDIFTNDTYVDCIVGTSFVAPDTVVSDNESVATVSIDKSKKKIIIHALTLGTFNLTATYNGSTAISKVTISKSKLYLDDERLDQYSMNMGVWSDNFTITPSLACNTRTMVLRCVDIGNPVKPTQVYRVLTLVANRYQKGSPRTISEDYACVDAMLENDLGYEASYALRPDDVNININGVKCTYTPLGSDKIYLGWMQRWYSGESKDDESNKVYNLYYTPLVPGTYTIAGTVFGETITTRAITVSASPVTIDPVTVTRGSTAVKPTFRFANDPVGAIGNGTLPYMTTYSNAQPTTIGGKTINYYVSQTDFNNNIHDSFTTDSYETRYSSTITPSTMGYFEDSIAGLQGDMSTVSQYLTLSASSEHIPGTYLSVYPVSIKTSDQGNYSVYGALLKITVK